MRFYQGLGFIDLEVDPEKVTPGELGKWCGDIIGDTPFNTEPYYLLRKPELNRQKVLKQDGGFVSNMYIKYNINDGKQLNYIL